MTATLRTMLTARTIGGQLLRSFLVLALLLVGSGALAYNALHGSAATASDALDVIRRDARQASALSAAVAGEIQAAGHYLRDGDSTALQSFHRLNGETHRITGALGKQATRDPEHVALVATVDRMLTDVEERYARAHRQYDAGDADGARRVEASVAEPVRQLLGAIDRLGALTEKQVTLVAAEMRREAEMRALAILLVFGVVIIVGTLLVGATLRNINEPLHKLVEHADALSRGAFETRSSGTMPGEFQRIANALNDAGTSLGVLAAATAGTASELASSSSELSQVSDRIAHKATEVSQAMESVTRGADNQVAMLKTIDTELVANNQRASDVRREAGSVATLAESIEREAMEKRRTIGQALSVMSEIRSSVQDASRTAESLHEATEGIAQFVTSVGRIAEQTNMLALNAAIEAARAGDAGRGFVVVADEVRKLAEAAQRAADDVARLTASITGGVNKTVSTMQRSAGLVGEIETVGRDVGTALESITASAERTVAAAANLSNIAAQNSAQLASVQQSLSVVARDAVGHATSAQQANASAQEQSAACQQMSAASQVLHGRSNRLRKLVESRDATGTTPGSTPEFVVRKLEVVHPTVEGGTPTRVTAVTPLNNRVLNRAPSMTPTRRPPTGKRQA